MQNNLKQYRKKQKITQFELAKMTDINPSDISQIENEKKFPFPGWRQRLSEALEVPENELFPEIQGVSK